MTLYFTYQSFIGKTFISASVMMYCKRNITLHKIRAIDNEIDQTI